MDTSQLDRAVWQELRTLSKDNAAGVAEHLVAAGLAMGEGDLDRALAHAKTASRRAGRVASVREALGVVHYRRGEWSNALAEFRTARRLSGSNHLLPQMADVERGLGRPERALELAAGPEAESLTRADRVELAIVVSGARRDLGQHEAGAATLRDLARSTRPSQPWAARLFYAYAEALLGLGQDDEAREWFDRALAADAADETDAAERLAELDGVAFTDLEEEADLEDQAGLERQADLEGQADPEVQGEVEVEVVDGAEDPR
ncbi:tetratricopeptide repeat protein [Ornithinicoccus hortensis]|uniref:Tetratricopeptide repeat protein n=1 Tax=Ornithinicoccus hortensis TaxID=82346 RepID=A0A542YSB6_9MICO|nr:tetratricopeptide repeat protein [Ornithinicoccus hortensis]TQL50993.1 tetratricopeptide repeat protein [Ornithinicoccus hortensis]